MIKEEISKKMVNGLGYKYALSLCYDMIAMAPNNTIQSYWVDVYKLIKPKQR